MKIYEYTPGAKLNISSCALALGFFDGVHEGHRRLLQTTKKLAGEKGLLFAVFTFVSENSFKGSEILYSTKEKLELLEAFGVEAVIISHFSSIMETSAEDFVKKSLISDMRCELAVAGYDFKFGKGARGNATLLSDIMQSNKKGCVIESEQRINGEKISTTKIKELLLGGEVESAREFLGVPYFIRGEVKRGNGVGHTLGFPTVNTDFENGKTPLARGVYRTAVDVDGKLYTGITNVGLCPTFKSRALHAETFIIDFEGDLYGKNIRIFFLDFLREEKQFNSPEELILQINVDKNRAIKENGELSWQEIGLN